LATYFMRRLLGGLVTFVIASFILHSLIFYAPTGIVDICTPFRLQRPLPLNLRLCDRIGAQYNLDVPWPYSYMLWLFNSLDDVDDPNLHHELDISIAGWRIKGYGLFTGNFQQSVQVARGIPTLQVYGIPLPTFLALMLALNFVLMLIAGLQRLGRPRIYLHRSPERPARRLKAVAVLG
jgi:ABC-type dipeptide/oligopeptide/nickel transport system permease component